MTYELHTAKGVVTVESDQPLSPEDLQTLMPVVEKLAPTKKTIKVNGAFLMQLKLLSMHQHEKGYSSEEWAKKMAEQSLRELRANKAKIQAVLDGTAPEKPGSEEWWRNVWGGVVVPCLAHVLGWIAQQEGNDAKQEDDPFSP